MVCKLCKDCAQSKGVELFGVDKRNLDGLKGICKECENARLKAWRSENKYGKYAAIQEKDKVRANQYYYANKEECDRKNKEWKLQNPERKKELDKQYYWSNPEKHRQYSSNWSKNNRDRVNARNKLTAHKYIAQKNAQTALRRSKKLQATPEWADKKAIQHYYKESKIKSTQIGIAMHVDHIVPLVNPLVCGLHVEYNLQVLPAKDNQSKGNRYWQDMP